MKLDVFSIRDIKTGAFATPFFAQNEAVAVRSFKRLCDDETSLCSYAPTDFQLFHIGSFDDETGLITSLESVNLITNGFLKSPQNNG